jgi:alpha-N-arabinofuranosidase
MRSRKKMSIAVDEWNVWYHSKEQDRETLRTQPWQVAPPLTEERYTLEDALVVGCLLISLLKHADRVKIACLAQLVNAIAPIMTETGGRAWRQTTYYPFLHASRYGRGSVLDVQIRSPRYDNPTFGSVPLVEAGATIDDDRETVTIFAVNRGQDGPLVLEGDLRCLAGYRVVEHLVLANADPKATNSADTPDTVVPHGTGDAALDDGTLTATLPRLSWNVIRVARTVADRSLP